MLALIQRVTEAKVESGGELLGSIGPGLLIFLGVAPEDTQAEASWLADKIVGLRIFADKEFKMNLSLAEVGGQALVISQFTLMGDCRKGRRPSFAQAAPPGPAEALYDYFADKIQEKGFKVGRGRFGADMAVSLTNDGPVTFILERKYGDSPKS
jgi:D-tyrosyl-tRNA(Tyr) deacylase